MGNRERIVGPSPDEAQKFNQLQGPLKDSKLLVKLGAAVAAALGLGASGTAVNAQPSEVNPYVSTVTNDRYTASLLNQNSQILHLVEFNNTPGLVEQEESGPGIIPLGNGAFYSKDGQTTRGFGIEGFSVKGPIYNAFQSRGGVSVWGKPVSAEFKDEIGRLSQAFEKGIFQLSPDGKGGWNISFANIFDELAKQGKDGWLEVVRQTPPSFEWGSDEGKSWPEVVENHLAVLGAYPSIQRYLLSADGWVEMFGLPMSVKDYGPWISVRMQRANLQLLKEDFPYGRKGDVLMANGGSVAKEIGGIIPSAVLKGEAIDNDFEYERREVVDLGGGQQRVTVRRKEITRLPSYYSQFEYAEEVVIKASSSVDSQRLKTAKEGVLKILTALRGDLKTRLWSYHPQVLIIPAKDPIDSLPEVRNFFTLYGGQENCMRGLTFQTFIVAGEELLGDSPGILCHEFAHAIHSTFTSQEWQTWQNLYLESESTGKAQRLTSCNREIYGSDFKCAQEYWAELSRMLFGGEGQRIAQADPEAFSFLQSVYSGF